MSKQKCKDKLKKSTNESSRSIDSLEITGLAYVLQPKNKKNLKNLKNLPQNVNRLPTTKEVDKKKKGLPSYCQLILMPMFATMSKITENLYLTSVGGMTKQNAEKYKIGCIINATYEAPNLKQKGIESIRIPVDDSERDDIEEFFDIVADKINEKTSKQINTVVHCVAGISRSTTLVIAYLMKYHRMDVRTSYKFVHSRRHVARPNNSFFKQLLNYEKKLFGKNSFKMVKLKINDIEIEVPDFFPTDHKGFTDLEIMKQLNKAKKNQLEAKKKEMSNLQNESTSSNGQAQLTSSRDEQASVKTQESFERTDEGEPREITAVEEKRREDLIRKFVVDYNTDDNEQPVTVEQTESTNEKKSDRLKKRKSKK